MTKMVVTYRGVVYPWHCDHMGHMNVMWYASKFDEATWQLLGQGGLTIGYLRNNNRIMAAVEQRITYKQELCAGDIITIRSGILEVREKVINFVHEMSNDGTNEIAATARVTGVHIDGQSRKTCPLPAEVLNRLRKMIIVYGEVKQEKE